MFRMTLILVRV